MNDIIKIIAWLSVTGLIGWSLLTIAFYNKRNLLFFSERLALSYALGLGVISLELAVLSAFGITFSRFSILAWWLPVVIIAAVLYMKDKKKGGPAFNHKSKLSFLEKFFILGVSMEALCTFFRAMIRPIESYDAIAIYAFKSKIFYMAKAIPRDFFTGFKSFVPHVEYPLMLPLSETYFYIFFGVLNDLLVKIIFPLYYLAAVIALYSVLRRVVSRKISLFATFLLATIPQFSEYGTNGYADIIVSFYYSASLLYLYLWMREKEGRFLFLSFIFSALSLWTKAEGIMMVAANLTIAGIYIMTDGRPSLKKGFFYCLGLTGLAAFYFYFKKSLGLALHSDFSGAGALTFKRVFQILYEYQRQFFGPKKWNIVWIVFLSLFVANLWKALGKELRYITLSLLFMFCGYAFIYMLLPGDIRWHLSTTASRFFIHFIPITVLWIALALKEAGVEI